MAFRTRSHNGDDGAPDAAVEAPRPLSRGSFEEAVQRLLDRPARDTAVVAIDLDGFATVNEGLGAETGDRLLEAVGARLAALGSGDATTGHLGGDRFALALPDGDQAALDACRARLQRTFADPFTAGGTEILIACSIGVVTADTGSDAARVVARVEAAARAAKHDPDGWQLVDERRAARAARLRTSLAGPSPDEDLSVHFRPVLAVGGGRLLAVEAVPVGSDAGEAVPAAELLALAEETGSIGALERRMLQEACGAASRLPASITVTVAVSPGRLDGPALARDVAEALASSGLAAHRLALEVPAPALVEAGPERRGTLLALRRLGVGVAVRAAHGSPPPGLHRAGFPLVDAVVLDASATAGAGSPDPVVTALVAGARELGVRTVVAGVETSEQLAAAVRLGCDAVAGDLLGRPVPRQVLEAGARPLASTLPEAGPPLRVLVVDDSEHDRELVRYLLEAAGHEVRCAVGPASAVALAGEHVDIALVDLHLGAGNGLDLAQQLRTLGGYGGVPIVAVTAYPDWVWRDLVGHGVFDGVVGKPLEPARFVEQVAAYAASSRGTQ